MHPGDNARAGRIGICLLEHGTDVVCGSKRWFPDEFARYLLVCIECFYNFFRIAGDLAESFISIKMLASGQEPKFILLQIDHFVSPSINCSSLQNFS